MPHRRPKPIAPRLLAGLAACLLVLAACGDDGDSGSALSEADFVAAYNEICLSVDEDISALSPESFEEAKEASAEAATIIDEGIAQLRALQPPDEIADEVEQGTDALAQTGEVFEELADAPDEAAFEETAAQIDPLRSEAEEALGPLGIECDGAEDDGADEDAAAEDDAA